MEGHEATIVAGERAPASGPVLAPRRLGRYVLLEELGRGGMGAVFGAYDPELDRKIAVKVLAGDDGDERRQTRLLREAQALARLAHPNVVAVHDVGLLDGQVYVAMEYVQGESLRRWLEQRRRWPETVDMFVQAGRGLVAAHAVGLVHRDFKPDNVIVGSDGRARVLDFGLAALAGAPAAVTPGPQAMPAGVVDGLEERPVADAATVLSLSGGQSHVPGTSLLSSRLTAAGAIMGTLAYMSPEQYAGAELDAATDQFSFCVALYEALCGQRPFAGETAAEYALAVLGGTVRPPPRGAEAPRWLLRALQRGLAVDPRARFPDMAALLAELSRDRGKLRRRLLAAGGAAAVCAGLLAAPWRPAEGRCSGAAAELAGVWDEGRRDAVARAFAATGLSHAPETLARVGPRLDRLADGWAAAHTATCQAHLRGELSDALFDREMICLKGQLRGVAARVELLARADAAAVDRAVEAIDGLPAPAECADPDRLFPERLVPSDPRLAAEGAALRERLVAVEAEIAAGHYGEAASRAGEALAAARTLGDPAVLAETELVAGSAHHGLGEYRETRERWQSAFWTATEIDHLRVATDAALHLLSFAADENSDPKEGALWRGVARALVRRSRGEDTTLGVWLQIGLAELAFLEGTRDEAERLAAEAVAAAERIEGPESLMTAGTHGTSGRILRNHGKLEEALGHYQRARELTRAAVGDHHPMMSQVANNLAAVLEDLQRLDEAEAQYLESIRLIEATAGAQATALGFVYSNLSDLYTRRGRFADAEAAAGRAVELFEREFGPEHPRTALVLNNLGMVLLSARREAEARPHFERSLAIYEKTLGADRYELSWPAHGLAVALFVAGEVAQAEAMFRRSLALTERSTGAGHAETAPEHTWIGRCLLAQRRHGEAIASLEQALAAWGDDARERPRVGEARFLLAQALWAGGAKGRPRALREAAQALAELRDAPPHIRTRPEEVEAWLAAHRGRG